MRAILMLAALAAAFLLSGCAATVYATNHGGRSALQQRMLSQVVDGAVEALAFGREFDGETVYMEVGDLDGEGVVGDYVRSAVGHSLMRNGAMLSPTPEGADIHLVVKVHQAGADRDAPAPALGNALISMIYYRQATTAEARLSAQGTYLAEARAGDRLLYPAPRDSGRVTTYEAKVAIPILFGWI